MSDRVTSLLVVLQRDFHEDDLAGVIAAIRMLKPVAEVQRAPGTDPLNVAVATARVRHEMRLRIDRALDGEG